MYIFISSCFTKKEKKITSEVNDVTPLCILDTKYVHFSPSNIMSDEVLRMGFSHHAKLGHW